MAKTKRRGQQNWQEFQESQRDRDQVVNEQVPRPDKNQEQLLDGGMTMN